jgi:hypothetical protein
MNSVKGYPVVKPALNLGLPAPSAETTTPDRRLSTAKADNFGRMAPMLIPREEGSAVISFRRYEYKYLITPAMIEPIRAFIQPYCAMDPFSQREPECFYTVKTLYLDSPNYTTYWDVLKRRPFRFKLRIRAYGDVKAGSVKFEIKRRFKDTCYKTSFKMPADSWADNLNASEDQGSLQYSESPNPALRRFLALAHSIRAEPKMLIQYERQAFQSRIDRYVRISFDRRICHQPKSTYDHKVLPHSRLCNDDPCSAGECQPYITLEIKAMMHPPLWLRDLVRKFNLDRKGYSKYCMAVTKFMTGAQRYCKSGYSLAVPR